MVREKVNKAKRMEEAQRTELHFACLRIKREEFHINLAHAEISNSKSHNVWSNCRVVAVFAHLFLYKQLIDLLINWNKYSTRSTKKLFSDHFARYELPFVIPAKFNSIISAYGCRCHPPSAFKLLLSHSDLSTLATSTYWMPVSSNCSFANVLLFLAVHVHIPFAAMPSSWIKATGPKLCWWSEWEKSQRLNDVF